MKDFFIDENTILFSEKNENSKHKEQTKTIDPFNPFDNPTENRDYNLDYSEIVPQIALDGCKLPNIPSDAEKKKIRRFYNIAGGGIAFHFLLSLIVSNAISFIVMLIIMITKGISISDFFSSSANEITQFMNTSSISPAITLLSYLTANLAVFFFGLKFIEVNPKQLFKTQNLTVLKVIQYILIAFCLQYAVGLIISFTQSVMSEADIYGTAQSLTTYYSPKYAVLSIIYSCLVAPVTEELLYRGFILKSFSRVSQHFGIIISALFFGLSHGNIAQFILAFIMGIFMGYITIKHNSVLPSIIIHVAVNTLATLFSVTDNYLSGDEIAYYNIAGFMMSIVDIAMTAMVIVLTVIGFILLIRFCKNNIFPKSDIRQQYRGANIAVTSVGTVIAALIYILFIILQTFS